MNYESSNLIYSQPEAYSLHLHRVFILLGKFKDHIVYISDRLSTSKMKSNNTQHQKFTTWWRKQIAEEPFPKFSFLFEQFLRLAAGFCEDIPGWSNTQNGIREKKFLFQISAAQAIWLRRFYPLNLTTTQDISSLLSLLSASAVSCLAAFSGSLILLTISTASWLFIT